MGIKRKESMHKVNWEIWLVMKHIFSFKSQEVGKLGEGVRPHRQVKVQL